MDIVDIIEAKEDHIIIEMMGELIERYQVDSICDYGCGDGRLLRILHDKFPSVQQLTGIDSWSSKNSLNSRPSDDGPIDYIDNASDYFADFVAKNSFDLVYSTFALHHFQLPVQELKRMEDLLAPGAPLVIIDMYRDYLDMEHIADTVCFYNNQMLMKALKGLYHRIPYTKAETADLLLALEVEPVAQHVASLGLIENEIKLYQSEIIKRREELARQERLEDQGKKLNPVFLDTQETIHQMVATLGQKYSAKPDDLLITVAKKQM